MQGQKTQQREIDGMNYTVTMFPASKALAMKHRLGKYSAGPIAALTGAGKGLKGVQELDISVLGPAIQAFFESCEENVLVATCKDLLGSTTRDGKSLNFDIDFSGNLLHLYKVLAFVIEVNFADFIGALKGRLR